MIAHGRLVAEGTLDELRRQAGNNVGDSADTGISGNARLEDTFLALVAEAAEAA